MIAITFALPTESAGLAGKLGNKTQTACGDSETSVGMLDGREVVILHTGVGAKVSAPRIESFLGTLRPKYLIASGFAGAVDEDLDAGDLLLAENFSDAQLLKDAQRALAGRNVRIGRLFTSASLVDSAGERHAAARQTGAIAVDMETAIIAGACAHRSIPMLSLRVISDSLQEPLPAPLEVLFNLNRQRTDYIRLLAHIVTHPATISRLTRFARQISRARDRLTNGLTDVVRVLET
jgi:adenosylhomocysteine nucleosidase